MMKIIWSLFTKSPTKRSGYAIVNRPRNFSSTINQLKVSRPRRSLLYVPGSSENKLSKINSKLKPDCAIMDCEDGVALTKKVEARETITRMLDVINFDKSEIGVRINAIDSEFAEEDLRCIFGAKNEPESIVIPKVENVDHIEWINDRLKKYSKSGSTNRICLIALIESAKAFLNLNDVCRRAQERLSHTRFPLDALIFGSDDFSASIGAIRTQSAREVLFARQYFVLVAKAYQLQAIDMVYIDYKDLEGFKSQCIEGAQMGFTGKQIIHPDQISLAEAAFSPSESRIEWATKLIKAFEDHQQSGKGAFTFGGSMIDMPTVLQAKNVLKLAESLSKT